MNTGRALWIQSVLEVAKEASIAIMNFYSTKKFEISTKFNNSPVTEADLKAHQIILAGLQRIDPHIPVLSEEGPEIPYSLRSKWSQYWLVDPLDGTKEFIRETGEFTINIALIENHIPVMGVIVAPALGKSYWAIQNEGAYFQEDNQPPKIIHVNKEIQFPIKIALSRHHLREEHKWEPLLKNLDSPEIVYCGSALKIGLVAQGIVDFYPRFGPTGEWDTAAGQCILEAAGGKLIDFRGNPLKYNARESLENPGFLAIGCLALLPNLVDNLSI